jgi:hypothetical protein
LFEFYTQTPEIHKLIERAFLISDSNLSTLESVLPALRADLLEWLRRETADRSGKLWESYRAKNLTNPRIARIIADQWHPHVWVDVFHEVADESVMLEFPKFFTIYDALNDLEIVNLMMDNWLTTSIYQVGMYNQAGIDECPVFPSEQEIESLLDNLKGETAECHELKLIEKEVSDLDKSIAEATAYREHLKSQQAILSVWRQKSARTKEVMGLLYDLATSLASARSTETLTGQPVPDRSSVIDEGQLEAFTEFLATILANVGVLS